MVPMEIKANAGHMSIGDHGHEKGAFTGAIQRHIGRFELATPIAVDGLTIRGKVSDL
jgi:hypothetical protein